MFVWIAIQPRTLSLYLCVCACVCSCLDKWKPSSWMSAMLKCVICLSQNRSLGLSLSPFSNVWFDLLICFFFFFLLADVCVYEQPVNTQRKHHCNTYFTSAGKNSTFVLSSASLCSQNSSLSLWAHSDTQWTCRQSRFNTSKHRKLVKKNSKLMLDVWWCMNVQLAYFWHVCSVEKKSSANTHIAFVQSHVGRLCVDVSGKNTTVNLLYYLSEMTWLKLSHL